MRVHLLYPDRDFAPGAAAPPLADRLAADLGLPDLWDAMSGGDRHLYRVCSEVMVLGLIRPEEIAYRQAVLRDFLAQPDALTEMYRLSVAAVEGERRIWGLVSRHPSGALHRAVEVLGVLVPILRELRDTTVAASRSFASEGLRGLASALAGELDDRYLEEVQAHLRELRLERGVLFSVRLGAGNRGSGHVLRRQPREGVRWSERLGVPDRSQLSFRIDPRDEAGFRALAELTDRGLSSVADAVARAADHVVRFATGLRWELGFYLGCVNLHAALAERGQMVTWPVAVEPGANRYDARGLADAALALRGRGPLVGNDVPADGRPLVVVTGANSGGKSTLLRAIGLAQVMLQAGMFVAALELRASPGPGVFTHFVGPEDSTMSQGKFAEELDRMSQIVDQVGAGALVLLNESFAATNEREGSEIGRQVVTALALAGVRVALVTHFFELADGFRRHPPVPALFLRAERGPMGVRTYRLPEGEPQPSAFGADLVGRLRF